MKKNKGNRAYRVRLATWYPNEVNPSCIVTCDRFFAPTQKEARKMFISQCISPAEIAKCETIKCTAIRRV